MAFISKPDLMWIDSVTREVKENGKFKLMTKSQLERTKWAKEFKKDCPVSYEQAINLALSGCEFEIADISKWRFSLTFAIVPIGEDFWMNCFKTHRAAVNFCKRMGWRLAE